jgi:hypothetical protein
MPKKLVSSKASILVKDLSSVPSIVGGLGLSIAAAQKAFNLDYIESVERLLAQAKLLLGGAETSEEGFKRFESLLQNLVLSLAPSRYQFTETTLAVRLDLAQTFSKSQEMGLGANVGAVAITAAMSSAFGYDYRASAEVRTVLHAIPADPSQFKALLDQAKNLGDKSLELPVRSEVDDEIYAASSRIFEKMVGKAPGKKVTNLEVDSPA